VVATQSPPSKEEPTLIIFWQTKVGAISLGGSPSFQTTYFVEVLPFSAKKRFSCPDAVIRIFSRFAKFGFESFYR
jgi:hypothetical protein